MISMVRIWAYSMIIHAMKGISDYPEHEWNINLHVRTPCLVIFLRSLTFLSHPSVFSLNGEAESRNRFLSLTYSVQYGKNKKQLSHPQEDVSCEFKLRLQNICGFLFSILRRLNKLLYSCSTSVHFIHPPRVVFSLFSREQTLFHHCLNHIFFIMDHFTPV